MAALIELVAAGLVGAIGNELVRPFMRARETAILLAAEVELNLASIELLVGDRRGWSGSKGAFGPVLFTHIAMSRTFLDAAGEKVALLPPFVTGRVLMCYALCAQIEETRTRYRAELDRLEAAPDLSPGAYETRSLSLLDTTFHEQLKAGLSGVKGCLTLLREVAKPWTMLRLHYARVVGRDGYVTAGIKAIDRDWNAELDASNDQSQKRG